MRSSKAMRIGITTHDLADRYFLIQLGSLVRHGVHPDPVILHHGGPWHGLAHRVRAAWRVWEQYRFAAPAHLRRRSRGGPKEGHALDEYADMIAEARAHLLTARVRRTGGINGRSARRLLSGLGPAVIVCNSGLLGRDVLALSGTIFLNVHVSRLPRFRGMNNVEWALFHQEPLWATVHRIAPGIDTGDILLQEPVATEGRRFRDIAMVRAHAFAQGHALVGRAAARLLSGESVWTPQPVLTSPLAQHYVMHPLLRAVVQRRLEAGGGRLSPHG